MINKIRLLLLLTVIAVGVYAGYSFFSGYEGAGTPLKIKIKDKGVDVEIENFKVEHQVLGRKDWELKADFAQVDTEKEITRLKNVEVVLNMKNDQQSTISADTGFMNNKTQEIELNGHVKFQASADEFHNRFNQVANKIPQ